MAEKKKILYIVEAMGGGVFTYIVDLANELVNKYDMYIAYAVRKQTPKNYKDYFDKRIHLIEVKNFGRAINLPCFEFTRSRTSIYSLWNFKVGIEWTDERNRTRTYKIWNRC